MFDTLGRRSFFDPLQGDFCQSWCFLTCSTPLKENRVKLKRLDAHNCAFTRAEGKGKHVPRRARGWWRIFASSTDTCEETMEALRAVWTSLECRRVIRTGNEPGKVSEKRYGWEKLTDAMPRPGGSAVSPISWSRARFAALLRNFGHVYRFFAYGADQRGTRLHPRQTSVSHC
jgi:hypothetical protein